MLQFLRKHQKYFFILITTAVIVSFCFFGTYGAMDQGGKVQDKEVVQGVCGKPLMQQELAALCRLIESSTFDRLSWEKGELPNFFNDGVIEKDFLGEGLAVMLGRQYFEDLKEDLELRVKKMHAFRPYLHPSSSQISVEKAWTRFSPGMLERFRKLKIHSAQPTPETFSLMCQLYLDQAMLPPDVLKQILTMQENQLGVLPDPILARSDLALFGYKSLQDWFGPKFIPLVAQYILNTAQMAEERGYDVKTEEVRADLYHNIYQGYQQISRNTMLSPEEADHYFHRKMRSLGLDEAMLISAWKKVMLFRRLFEDGSGSVLIDPIAYRQFDTYAKESARVSLYELPTALQFTDFRAMLTFQVYLESIASDPSQLRTSLHLPTNIASLEQIEKRAPELVERSMQVQWSVVSLQELCKKISVKQTWQWEATDAGFEMIKTHFPELNTASANTPQLRQALLNRLEEGLRSKIDQFARQRMVQADRQQIQWALKNAPMKTSVIGLRMKGTTFPFPGIKETGELTRLLQNASLKAETENAASRQLNCYSPDEEHYYCIEVLHRDEKKKVLTFGESFKEGILEKLLDKKLEGSYPDVRKRYPASFQQNNGQWRSFKEVKDQVGKYVFADLLKAIEMSYVNEFGLLPGQEGELPLSFYSNARLLVFMKQAQRALTLNPTDPAWIRATDQGETIEEQWRLIRSEKVMQRCTQAPFSKEEMFDLDLQQWSPLKVGERGSLAFYFVEERGSSQVPPVESVLQGHQNLSVDAKRDMMVQLLEKMKEKKAISIRESIHGF